MAARGKGKGKEQGKLELADGVPLHDGLAKAVAQVLAYARDAAGEAERTPDRAVHETRKSLRRARAVVKLTRPLLADADYARLAKVLKETQQATSALRDDDALRAIARKLGGNIKLRGPILRRHPVEVLPALSRRLKPVARTFADVVPGDVDWKDLAKGLRKTYRRARRAMKAAARTGKHARLHDWRKATKELAYQLELLEGPLGKRAARERKRFGDLAEDLGEITDLALLERHLRKTRAQAPKSARARMEEVRGEARRRIARAEQRVHARGRKLYDRKPGDFLSAALRRARKRGTTSQRKKVAAAQSQAKRSPTAA